MEVKNLSETMDACIEELKDAKKEIEELKERIKILEQSQLEQLGVISGDNC
jgi:uncharacterized coiled-coil DUF342 family protein